MFAAWAIIIMAKKVNGKNSLPRIIVSEILFVRSEYHSNLIAECEQICSV